MNNSSLGHAGRISMSNPEVRQQTLLALTREISLEHNLTDLEFLLLRAARVVTDSDGAVLAFCDREDCLYVLEDANEVVWEGQRSPAPLSLASQAMVQLEPIVIEDTRHCGSHQVPEQFATDHGVHSLIVVPLKPINAAVYVYWMQEHRPVAQEVGAVQALANAAVQALGGQIVETPDTVPRRHGAMPAGTPLLLEEEVPGAARLLLVEDNPTCRFMTCQMLRRLGYRVDTAQNGQEAVRAVTTQDYALVIMDCDMPVLDGFSATRVIRDQERPGRRLPIVAVTARVLPGEREKCLAAGMDDYLPKPICFVTLADTVRLWVGAGESQRQLHLP